MTKRKSAAKKPLDNPMITDNDVLIEAPEEIVVSEFAVHDNMPEPPVRKRGGNKVEKYPFGTLEVGQGFFIEPTEKTPEPWKAKQSTVTGAMRRYAKVLGMKTKADGKEIKDLEYTRKFKIYPVELDGRTVAAVTRTA